MARSLASRLGRATATMLQSGRPAAAPRGAFPRAFGRGARSLLGSFGRALRHIGLQIAAVIYFIFAAGFAGEAIRVWRHAHVARRVLSFSGAPASAQLELVLALVFAYFGVSSLFRTRQ